MKKYTLKTYSTFYPYVFLQCVYMIISTLFNSSTKKRDKKSRQRYSMPFPCFQPSHSTIPVPQFAQRSTFVNTHGYVAFSGCICDDHDDE